MRELYIYWRARPGEDEAAADAARNLQRQWRAQVPDLQARLLWRAGAPGHGSTWMEVYARPGGIDAALERLLREQGDAALTPWLDGPRRLEAFEADAGRR